MTIDTIPGSFGEYIYHLYDDAMFDFPLNMTPLPETLCNTIITDYDDILALIDTACDTLIHIDNQNDATIFVNIVMMIANNMAIARK
jgi:hypothetical protein